MKNLPPHVRRELLRHVSRDNDGGATTTRTPTMKNGVGGGMMNEQQERQAAMNAWQRMIKSRQSGVRRTLWGTILFVGCTSSLPIMAWLWIGNLTQKENALTPAQVRRGAFLNTGSRDVGKDPDWDFQKGQHKYEKGYGELTEERLPSIESSTRLGQLYAPVPETINTTTDTKRDQKAMTAVAQGLPPTYRSSSSSEK